LRLGEDDLRSCFARLITTVRPRLDKTITREWQHGMNENGWTKTVCLSLRWAPRSTEARVNCIFPWSASLDSFDPPRCHAWREARQGKTRWGKIRQNEAKRSEARRDETRRSGVWRGGAKLRSNFEVKRRNDAETRNAT